MFAGFLALSFVGEIVARRSMSNARKRVRTIGTTNTVSMDENGIDAQGILGNSHLNWPAMLKPAIYPNGVLIKFSRTNVVWLPDQSLVEGSPADVRQLLATNVKAGNSSGKV